MFYLTATIHELAHFLDIKKNAMINCRLYIKRNCKATGVFGGLYGNIVHNSPKDFLFLFIPSFKKKRARENRQLKPPNHTFSEEKNHMLAKR